MENKVALGDICGIKYGKDHKKLDDGAIPVYGSGGVIRYIERALWDKPSVLIPRKGTLGNLFFVDKPFWTVDTLFWTDIDESCVLPKYLFYQLKTKDLANLNVGTAVPSLTVDVLNEVEIHLPPLETQKQATEVLSVLDNKIAANVKLNGYLEELFDLEFRRFLEKSDSNWETVSLLDVADYKNGLAMQKFRPSAGDKGLPVLKIRELGQESCENDAERCRSDIDESVVVHDGDLVFSWSGTLLLKFWAGGDAGLNQHLFKVTSRAYPSWFYYAWTKHHLGRFIMLAKDRATTMGHIKRSALAESKVLLPPAHELARWTKLMQPLIGQILSNKTENHKLVDLRDTLLPKLMSGEIGVSRVKV